MGQKRPNLEWQLSNASAELATCEKELDQQGLAVAARPRHPKWRNLNARCRQLRHRLAAVAKIEANNEELKQRRAAVTAEA
jgi:hypothetical protein